MAISEEQIGLDYAAYESYRDDTSHWRELRDKAEKFYAGSQHSTSHSQELSDRGQSDIVLNKLRPLLLTRISAMIANKPTGVIYGTRKEDVGLAQVLMDFVDYHFYASMGNIVMERTVTRQQKHGIGWMALYSDNIADFGRGELRFIDLSYRNVFVDKAAGAKPLFDDAPVMIVTKLMRPLDFFNSLPKKVRKRIPNDQSLYVDNDEIYWSGRGTHEENVETGTPMLLTNTYPEEKADYVRLMDVYRRKVVDVRVIRQKMTGKVYKVLGEDEEPAAEEKILMQKKIADLQLEQMGLDPRQVDIYRLEEVEVPNWRVDYYQQVSGVMVIPESEELLPISNYPIAPVVCEDTGNAMPLGEVDFMIPQQEMINTAIGLTLLNAALASNWRVLVDSGAAQITDLKKFESNFSIPGSWHNMKRDVNGKFPIEIIRPEPLPQAWFMLLQYFSQAMEFQLSTFAFRTGDPKSAPDTYGATLQLGQWANDVLRIPLGRLEIAVERLFNTLLEWMPHYYTFAKSFELIGLDDNPTMREINMPYFDEVSGAWKTLNSLDNIRANYRIRLGSTAPSQSTYQLQVMQQLAQLQPALIANVIDLMPGLKPNEKQEIKQTIDQVMQLTGANEQKEQIIQTLQSQMTRMQETIVAMEREKALSKVEREVDQFVLEMRNQRQQISKSRNGNPKTAKVKR